MAEDEDWGNTLDDESVELLRRVTSSVLGLRQNIVGGNASRSDGSRLRTEPGIQFYNDTTETVPAYACMRITGFTDSDGETGGTAGKGSPILKIGKPDTTFGLYVCNGGLDVATHDYGTCYDSGPVQFLYNSGTPARSEGFGPTPSQWYWSKGFPCGVMCYGNLDSTLKVAHGILSPITTLLGKTTAAVAANTSTTDYQIYAGTLGSESDAGFTTVPAAVTRFAFGTGAWVTLHWADSAWEMRPYANYAYAATLGGTLANGASTTVTLSDGRSVSATNYSGGSLSAGTYVAILDMATGTYMLTGGGGGGGGSGPNDVLEGWVYSPFDTSTEWFLVKVSRSYNGTLSPGAVQQIYNYANAGPNATTPYLFQGEYGKSMRAEYDTDSAVYRVDWVECSPKAGIKPPSPGEQATMYDYGGQSAHVPAYY